MVLIKKRSRTNPEYGCPPEKRSVEQLLQAGIVNLNKPGGPTSTKTDELVKEILKIKKAGHGGTLDPKASGVLPIGLNDGTKVLQALLKAKKEYIGVMHLHKDIDNEKLLEGLEHFTGIVEQKPPARSAVRRVKRKRKVYKLELIKREGKDCTLRVICEAGLYVRKLFWQIGEYLGCGAHMVRLKRTKAGPFSIEDSITLEELKEAYNLWKKGKMAKLRKYINPIEKGVEHLPKIWVLDTTIEPICHGAPLAVPGVSKLTEDVKKDNLVALMTLKNELVALGRAKLSSEEIMKKEKGIAAELERVIMKRGTYKIKK